MQELLVVSNLKFGLHSQKLSTQTSFKNPDSSQKALELHRIFEEFE